MFYIGIDGGGTKTKFTLINERNEIIFTIEKGTCHYNQIGFDGTEKILSEGLKDIIESTNLNISDIKGVCLGLAGYGKVKSDADKLSIVVKKVFGNTPYKLLNDVQIAHAAALALEDGVVIISGTGSIGYSVNDAKTRRVGGWGYSIGDEGSAYWIGKKTIEEFSKQADGRREKTKIYYILKEELNLEDSYQLINYIYNHIKSDRGEIAKLAQICTKAATDGDKVAIDILEEAGKELAMLINALADDFPRDRKVKASYVGGVFKCGNLIIDPIRKNLNENIEFVHPKYTPDVGACILAKMEENYV